MKPRGIILREQNCKKSTLIVNLGPKKWQKVVQKALLAPGDWLCEAGEREIQILLSLNRENFVVNCIFLLISLTQKGALE